MEEHNELDTFGLVILAFMAGLIIGVVVTYGIGGVWLGW